MSGMGLRLGDTPPSRHRPDRGFVSAVHVPLRSELAIIVVVMLLLTYWIVTLVLGIGNVRDGAGNGVDVRGVQITTPSTTPAVIYKP